jgi:GT2 family glycosyltransferase
LEGIGEKQSVSNAWNKGIEKAKELGCDYVMVINTDIVFKTNLIDRLVAFAEKEKDVVMWTASEHVDLYDLETCNEDENYSEHPNFSCFMVKSTFFDNVGKFDENFIPAYVEDGDMHARLALANLKAYVFGGAKFYHKRSNTIKTDAQLWNKNASTFPKNQQYFLEKWGHPPVNTVEEMRETYYKHPYNEEDKPLSYWRVNGK